MLGVAVVCGLLAVVLAAQWLTNQSSRGIERIAVAASDISLGQRLTPDLVKIVDWPASSTPPGAHKDIAGLDGRVLRTSLLRGEAIIDAKLAPLGTTGGLSAVIGEGRRAMTVRVNDVIGVAGFALPETMSTYSSIPNVMATIIQPAINKFPKLSLSAFWYWQWRRMSAAMKPSHVSSMPSRWR